MNRSTVLMYGVLLLFIFEGCASSSSSRPSLGGIPMMRDQSRTAVPVAAPLPPEQTMNTVEMEGVSIQ
jgi:hypothetical protein